MSVAPVFSLSSTVAPMAAEPAAGSAASGTFGRLVNDFLASAAQDEAAVNHAVKDLALGNSQDFHNVALTTARADLNFRFVLEVRNKLIEAYQDVMRMQV